MDCRSNDKVLHTFSNRDVHVDNGLKAQVDKHSHWNCMMHRFISIPFSDFE